MSGYFGFNVADTKNRVLQSIYANGGQIAGSVGQNTLNLGSLFNGRMQAIMQQLAQFTDTSSLPVHAGNIEDAARALKIHNFAQVTDTQMDAKNMEASFKSGLNYLSVV